METVKRTRAELSYSVRYDSSDLAQEYLALDLSSAPLSVLSLTGRLRYDLVGSRYSDIQVGADVTAIPDLVLKVEYYNCYPTFDQFSFYHFFDVDRYQEVGFAAEYRLTSRYILEMRYAHEDFNENAVANLVDAGFRIRPIDNFTLNLKYEWRNGYAGWLSGVRFDAGYRIEKAGLLAGIDYDDFHREDSREGTAKKYWVALTYEICKEVSAALRGENNVNFYFSQAYRGFLTVNVHL